MSLIQPLLNAYLSENTALRKPTFTLNSSRFKDMLAVAYQSPINRPLFNVSDTGYLLRTMQAKIAAVKRGNFELWGEAAATFRAIAVNRRARLSYLPPLSLVAQRAHDTRKKLPVWLTALCNIQSGLFAQWIAWPIFDSWLSYYRLPLKTRRRFLYSQLYDPRLRSALRQYRHASRAFGGGSKRKDRLI